MKAPNDFVKARKYLTPFLFILSIFQLTSCAHLKEFPIEGNFEGVKTALDRNDTVSLLIIHGAGGFSKGDPDTFICALARNLRLRKVGKPFVRNIIDDTTSCCECYGQLKRYDYHGCGKSVRIYVLDWTPSTEEQKQQLQRIDARYACEILPSMYHIKKTIVNNDLSDAILYLSDTRQKIEHAVIQSIQWITDDSSNLQNENIVVGFSAGGLLVVNALDTMLHGSGLDLIAKKYLDQISAVFFLSNLYPLLELSETKSFPENSVCPPCCCDKFWDWRTSALGRFIFIKRKTDPGFQIVAMHDPNDLISYKACDYFVPSDTGFSNAFLNESVRNAKTAFFGYVDPFAAHTSYGSNPKVLYMIIFGRPCFRVKN